jgi:hypothetical protein
MFVTANAVPEDNCRQSKGFKISVNIRARKNSRPDIKFSRSGYLAVKKPKPLIER